jgi:hypothetical protein
MIATSLCERIRFSYTLRSYQHNRTNETILMGLVSTQVLGYSIYVYVYIVKLPVEMVHNVLHQHQ